MTNVFMTKHVSPSIRVVLYRLWVDLTAPHVLHAQRETFAVLDDVRVGDCLQIGLLHFAVAGPNDLGKRSSSLSIVAFGL